MLGLKVGSLVWLILEALNNHINWGITASGGHAPWRSCPNGITVRILSSPKNMASLTVWSSICTTTSHSQFYFDGFGLGPTVLVLILSPYPANTKCWPSVGLMLGDHLHQPTLTQYWADVLCLPSTGVTPQIIPPLKLYPVRFWYLPESTPG